MSRALRPAVWTAACVVLAGCQTVGGAGPPPRTERITPTTPTVDEAGLGSVDMPPSTEADLSDAAMTAHSATLNAATMPGYTPAAGVAGQVLGLGIAKVLEDAS